MMIASLACVLSACAPQASVTPTRSLELIATQAAGELGQSYNERTQVAQESAVAALALTNQHLADIAALDFQKMQDAYQLQIVASREAAQLQIVASRQAATETRQAHETEQAATATAIPTSAAKTATRLAQEYAIGEAERREAESSAGTVVAVRGYLDLIVFVLLGLGAPFLAGLAWAEYRRRIIYAENYRPQEMGGLVIYPDGKGAYTHRRIEPFGLAIAAPVFTPEPEQSTQAIERFIPYNAPGKATGDTLAVSSTPDASERDKREALIAALLAFRARGALSKDGKPSLKLSGLTGPGKPFPSNDDWVTITDVLASNDLALKGNGDESTLVGSYEAAIARVQDYTRPLSLPSTSLPRIRYAALPKVG